MQNHHLALTPTGHTTLSDGGNECSWCGVPPFIHRETLKGATCDMRWALARFYVVAIQSWARPTVLWLARQLDKIGGAR